MRRLLAVALFASAGLFAQTPNISFLSPSEVPLNSPTTSMFGSGTGLDGTAVVLFDPPGAVGAQTLAISDTSGDSFFFSIPASLLTVEGIATVQIRNGNLQVSNIVQFFIVGAYRITNVVPNATTQRTSGSVDITVNGAGFGGSNGSGSQVIFNPVGGSGETSISTTVVSPFQVTATIPGFLLSNPGTASLLVNTAGTNSNSLPFTINPTPVINPTTLPNGFVGEAYSQSVSVTGGTAPFGNWVVSAGALPSGLGINPTTGAITGSPTALQTSNFTISRTDSAGIVASRAYTVHTAPRLNQTSGATLAPTTTGATFTRTFTATGGNGTFIWSLLSGTAPGTVNSNGTLTGPATAPGTYNFTVRVADTNTAFPQIDDQAYSIVVNAAPVITTTSLPATTNGASYNQPLAATGGTAPFSWDISGGALPGGLTINPSTGQITGTVSATPATYNFTALVVDSQNVSDTQALSIVVSSAPVVDPPTLSGATVGVPYSQGFTSSGGTGALTLSLIGTAPPGLTFTPGAGGSGTLSGTPTTANSFPFSIRATDSLGVFGQRDYVLVVSQALGFVTTTLPNTTVGANYNQTVVTSGGVGTRTLSLSAGALPTGLSLVGNSITGTPSVANTFNFTLSVTDSAENTASQAFTIVVASPPTVDPATLGATSVGANYSQVFTSTGGTGAKTFTLIGTPPPGLTFSGATLSGIPSTTGSFPFTIRATDTAGVFGERAYTLVVSNSLSFTTTSLPNTTVGASYNQAVVTAGGVGTRTLSLIAGALPTGLSLVGNSITGTPTVANTFNFTLGVTDSAENTASQAFTIVVASPPTVDPATLGPTSVGATYSQVFTSTGGTGAKTFSLIGTAPAGLTFNPSTATLSGTPSTNGSFPFTIRATDTAGVFGERAYTLVVSNSLTFTTTSLPNTTVGASYNQAVVTAGGVGTRTLSLFSGTLPTGLNLAGSSITGTPSVANTFTFTLRVTDAQSNIASQAFTIVVAAAPVVNPATIPGSSTGASYSQTFTATGGTGAITFSLIGTAPSGLTFSGATLSGSPNNDGQFPFTIRATDSVGAFGERAYTLVVGNSLRFDTTSLPNTTVGATYNQQVSTSGGVGARTLTLDSGTLPTGTALVGSNITGTPNTANTFNFVLRVTDSRGNFATQAFTIVVAAAPTVNPATIPGATVGSPYSQVFTATGGTGAITFSLVGTPPPGLAFSGATLSGTPTNAGPVSVTIRATDSVGVSSQRTYSLTINAALRFDTTALPDSVVGLAYNQTVLVSGGFPPVTIALDSGALPAGTTLSGNTISGTTTTANPFNFVLRATDSMGNTVTQAYTVTVFGSMAITTASLANGSLGAPLTRALAVTGGRAPYTWSISGGSLPGGITINSGTGALSGTPTAGGSFTFIVSVSDSLGASATRSLTLSILALTKTVMSSASVGGRYSDALTATGGTQPYSFSISGGSLPAGLSLNAATGEITGTPTTDGTSAFTATVADATGVTHSVPLSITVGVAELQLTTETLPEGIQGNPYSATLSASGGGGSITFSVSGGSLPPGISLNATTGVLSGTPTERGTFRFNAQVTSGTQAAGRLLTIVINPPALTISTVTLPPATLGTAYSASVSAAGGVAPYSFAVPSGSLPDGVSMNAAGTFTGTPTAAGNFSFRVRVTDSRSVTADKDFTIAVLSSLTITSTSPLRGGMVNTPFSFPFVAAGGTQPYTFSLTGGTLPDGLTLNSAGTLAGTPTRVATFTFTVQVTDSTGARASRDFELAILLELRITTESLPAGGPQSAYSAAVVASGGNPPYTFSIASGALPEGVTMDANGNISGTPARSGSFVVTIRATDRDGRPIDRTYTINIGGALRITTPALPAGRVGDDYTASVTVEGGVAPYTLEVAIGALPLGLAPQGASIVGRPALAGSFTVTLRATDSSQPPLSATAEFTLQIAAVPVPTPTITVLPETPAPGTQPGLNVVLSSSYPVDLRGELSLAFAPQMGADNPQVRFLNGERLAEFTVPARETQGTPAQIGLQIGNVAGTITLTTRLFSGSTEVTSQPPPTRAIVIPPGPPVIESARLVRAADSLQVIVVGFVTNRQVTQGSVRLEAASGATLSQTDFTIPVTNPFTAYFNSADSVMQGSNFVLTIPFGGNGNAVASAQVTLGNSLGTANATAR